MKTKSIITAVIFAVSTMFTANAQNNQLTGKVTNIANQPLQFANVVLCSKLDSTVVAGAVTNAKGEYALKQITLEDTFLKVSFVGYETQTVVPEDGQSVVLDFGNIMLDEVVVVAKAKPARLQNVDIATNTLRVEAKVENNLSKIIR